MSFFEARRPRYHVVADALSQAIQRGTYPVGSLLPTEAELCEQFGLSRQTIREATRLLVELGLASRRQGVGTRVERRDVSQTYVQRLERTSDIWQYVEETSRKVLKVADVPASRARVRLPGEETRRWRMLEGLRFTADDRRPIAWTQVYVAPEYAAVTDARNRDRVPIFSLIEQRFGVKASRIRQDISAVSIGSDVAGLLGVPSRSVGLSVVREYVSTVGEVFEVTMSVHPGNRYHYSMQLDLAYSRDNALTAERLTLPAGLRGKRSRK
ncbi:MAG: GntR family transcriptional regulator [Gemmatimonadaceae bacterium]